MQKTDYRSRIFARYSSVMQDQGTVFDERSAKRWAKAYRKYVRRLLPKDKSVPIADVGCGWGRFLYLLKCEGYTDLTGVDISPEQADLARQVVPEVVEGDAIQFLESRPRSFAFISAMDIIEHFKKEEVLRFLDACFSALKPGGRLLVQTPNAESPWGMMHRYNDFTHEIAFDPACLKRILRVCGFEKAAVRGCGPVVHGLKSAVRWCLWRLIRTLLLIWNLAETGSKGSGVYTRIFIAFAVKPE